MLIDYYIYSTTLKEQDSIAYRVPIIMDALRPYMRLLCGRGTGFGLIAHPLCVGEENGWEVAYVA